MWRTGHPGVSHIGVRCHIAARKILCLLVWLVSCRRRQPLIVTLWFHWLASVWSFGASTWPARPAALSRTPTCTTSHHAHTAYKAPLLGHSVMACAQRAHTSSVHSFCCLPLLTAVAGLMMGSAVLCVAVATYPFANTSALYMLSFFALFTASLTAFRSVARQAHVQHMDRMRCELPSHVVLGVQAPSRLSDCTCTYLLDVCAFVCLVVFFMYCGASATSVAAQCMLPQHPCSTASSPYTLCA